MEAAVATSSGLGLCCTLNAVSKQHKRNTRVGFVTRKQTCSVKCKHLLHLKAGVYTSAVLKDNDTENAVIKRKKLAVLTSGGGSNFRSIHKAALSGVVHGDVVVLVTDQPGSGGAEHARSDGIPVVAFPGSKSAQEGVSTAELLNALRELDIDFVLLAGYLKLIPVELVQAYRRSILNIHPSLLPAFGGKGYYGLKVHKAVIASGARYSGPTVHFVDEHYDTGKTLAQRVVPVLADDTPEQLAAKSVMRSIKSMLRQLLLCARTALCGGKMASRLSEGEQILINIPN